MIPVLPINSIVQRIASAGQGAGIKTVNVEILFAAGEPYGMQIKESPQVEGRFGLSLNSVTALVLSHVTDEDLRRVAESRGLKLVKGRKSKPKAETVTGV